MSSTNSQLNNALYEQLRAVARYHMQNQRIGHTLQATAVVHEAWIRMRKAGVDLGDECQMFVMASTVIRRILIDYARRKMAKKRGGCEGHFSLDECRIERCHSEFSAVDLLTLDQLLSELSCSAPREAMVVEMKYFGDLTMDQIARALGVSKRSVESDWTMARAWLLVRMKG